MDDQIAFVGGINILDDFDDVPLINGEGRPRFDFAVRCEGPIVDDMVRAQQALWLRMAWRRRKDWDSFTQRFTLWREWRKRRQERKKAEQAGQVFEGIRASLLLRDNVRHRQQIEQAYLQLLCKAKEQVILANAYFFPGRTLRRRIEQAAERGVRVRLLLQGHAEYFLQYRACRFMYGQLLDHGIELYEYKASYLHAKVAVVDPDHDRPWATVGSSNLDPLSLLLAREANVVVEDAAFARDLRQRLVHAMQHAGRRMDPARYAGRPLRQRVLDRLAFGLMRLALWLTGHRY